MPRKPKPKKMVNHKVQAMGIGAAGATVIVFILEMLGQDVPVGLEGTIATVVGFVAGYLKRET